MGHDTTKLITTRELEAINGGCAAYAPLQGRIAPPPAIGDPGMPGSGTAPGTAEYQSVPNAAE